MSPLLFCLTNEENYHQSDLAHTDVGRQRETGSLTLYLRSGVHLSSDVMFKLISQIAARGRVGTEEVGQTRVLATVLSHRGARRLRMRTRSCLAHPQPQISLDSVETGLELNSEAATT